MSGLQNFINRPASGSGQHSTPSSNPQARQSRAGAEIFKVKTNRFGSPSSKYTNHAAQASFTNASQRGVYPSFHENLKTQSRESLDDSSVPDDFDETMSEVIVERLNDVPPIPGNDDQYLDQGSSEEGGRRSDYGELQGDFDVPTREQRYHGDEDEDDNNTIQAEHMQTKPPPSRQYQRLNSPMALRQQPQHAQQPLYHNSASMTRFSKQPVPIQSFKQEHSGERVPQAAIGKRSYSPDLPQNNRHLLDRYRNKTDLPGASSEFSLDGADEEHQSASPERTPRTNRKSEYIPSDDVFEEEPPRHGKPVKVIIDYDDKTLERMTYAQVESTGGWDDPVHKDADNRPLEERLQDIVEQTVIEPGNFNTSITQFFENLSTAEWEQSGDWFVDQFARIMGLMKAKRAQRRMAVSRFEGELKRKEDAVRGESDNLDRVLKDMRASGEDMLRGKV